METVKRVFGFAVLFTALQYLQSSSWDLQILLYTLLSGMLLTLPFLWLARILRYRTTDRVIVFWIILYIIQLFSNLIELYFFSSIITDLTKPLLRSLELSFIEALALGLLFPSVTQTASLHDNLKRYFSGLSPAGWLFRILLAGLTYLPVYFLFGMLVSPFVLPYYRDPSLHLTIPSFSRIVPLEIVRGYLYIGALIPVLAGIQTPKKRTVWAVLAATLYIPGALVPLLTGGSALVAPLRFYHSLEILGDYLLFSVFITLLLYPKKRS